MPNKLPVARYLIHRACAYPFAICWVIGTLAIWIPLTMQFARDGVFGSLAAEWKGISLMVLCYAATSGLGFFGGAFFVSWLILPFCRRFNGAPHEAGEHVLILSGPHSGTESDIYEITTGQGGQPVPRVDLGAEARNKFQDLFDDYALLRRS